MFSDYIFIAVPAVVFAVFIVCASLYISAVRAEKKKPGSFSTDQLKGRKIAFIISGIIAAIMLTVIIGILILFAMVIAYM